MFIYPINSPYIAPFPRGSTMPSKPIASAWLLHYIGVLKEGGWQGGLGPPPPKMRSKLEVADHATRCSKLEIIDHAVRCG